MTAGVSEACAERTGLDHGQRVNDEHLRFTRVSGSPDGWTRPEYWTLKALEHQLVGAD